MTLSLDHRNSIISPQWHHSSQSCSTVIVSHAAHCLHGDIQDNVPNLCPHRDPTLLLWSDFSPPFLMVFLHHRRRRRRGTQGCPRFAWHRRQEATNDQSLSLIIVSRHVDGLHINPACQYHHEHHIGSWSIVGFPASGVRPLDVHPEKSWSKGAWPASPLGDLPLKEIIHQKSAISTSSSMDLPLRWFDWWNPTAPDDHLAPGK